MQGEVSCRLPNIACTLTLLTPNGGDGKGRGGVADTNKGRYTTKDVKRGNNFSQML